MRPKADRRHLRRGVVDTSVLVAGISAFRRDEYRDVLRRLKVRRATVGRVINLLAEAAEAVPAGPYRGLSPDPGDEPFCACAENGGADFIVTLNPSDFPTARLAARVIAPGESLPGPGRSSGRRTGR